MFTVQLTLKLNISLAFNLTIHPSERGEEGEPHPGGIQAAPCLPGRLVPRGGGGGDRAAGQEAGGVRDAADLGDGGLAGGEQGPARPARPAG